MKPLRDAIEYFIDKGLHRNRIVEEFIASLSEGNMFFDMKKVQGTTEAQIQEEIDAMIGENLLTEDTSVDKGFIVVNKFLPRTAALIVKANKYAALNVEIDDTVKLTKDGIETIVKVEDYVYFDSWQGASFCTGVFDAEFDSYDFEEYDKVEVIKKADDEQTETASEDQGASQETET